MSIKILERKDGKVVRLQAHIYALRPGSLRAERVRINVPASITSKSAAVRWAEAVRRDLEAGKPPPQTREAKKRATAEVVEREQATKTAERAGITMRAWVDEYLVDCAARRVRRTTIDLRRGRLRHLLAVAGDRRVADFGELDWAKLRRALVKLAASTANEIQDLVAQVLRAAERMGLRGPVPRPAKIRPDEDEDAEPEAYTVEEYERLVAAAAIDGDVHLAVVLLGGDAGLRRGEIAGLRADDLEPGGVIHVRRTIVQIDEERVAHAPKSGKTRKVPTSQRLLAVLQRLCAVTPDGWLVRNHLGEPAFARQVSGLVAQCQRRAKMPEKGPHKLRHTFATQALQAGATLREVQRLLGHSSITQTERYLHATPSSIRGAIDRLAQHREAVAADTGLARHGLELVEPAASAGNG